MRRRARWGGLAAVVVLLSIAAPTWQYAWRTRPEQLGPRFVEGSIARHPGTTIGSWQFQRLHLTLPTGVDDAGASALTMQASTTGLRTRVPAYDSPAPDGSTLSFARTSR